MASGNILTYLFVRDDPADVAQLKKNRDESNLSVGLVGRGKALMTGAQVDRVNAIAETLGATKCINGT